MASADQFDGQGDYHAPRSYVRKAFRKYLECGILAHGFARARCDDCGHDYFVSFSCKGRGICPSSNTRRMVETAVHLMDHVFPRLAVRQWVLSVPKRLRYSDLHVIKAILPDTSSRELCASLPLLFVPIVVAIFYRYRRKNLQIE